MPWKPPGSQTAWCSAFSTASFLASLALGLRPDVPEIPRWTSVAADYDAERTADLFCTVCNQFQGVFEASRRRLAAAGPLEAAPSRNESINEPVNEP